jgi:hypothetical protein
VIGALGTHGISVAEICKVIPPGFEPVGVLCGAFDESGMELSGEGTFGEVIDLFLGCGVFRMGPREGPEGLLQLCEGGRERCNRESRESGLSCKGSGVCGRRGRSGLPCAAI